MNRQKEMTELETCLGSLLEADSVDEAMDMYLAASQQLGVLFRAQIEYIREVGEPDGAL